MTTMTLFRTYCEGGMEGRVNIKDTYETEEMARENARNNRWNDYYKLYKVEITFNGKVTEEEIYIGRILSGKDIARIDNANKQIEEAKVEIERIRANNRIRVTKENRIEEQKKIIRRNEEYIKWIKEEYK